MQERNGLFHLRLYLDSLIFRGCEVYIIVEDPLSDLYKQFDKEKTKLASLLGEDNDDKTNAYLDDSMTFDDLVSTLVYLTINAAFLE